MLMSPDSSHQAQPSSIATAVIRVPACPSKVIVAPPRPETPEYTRPFPVMEPTVASSLGEPELNIGKSSINPIVSALRPSLWQNGNHKI